MHPGKWLNVQSPYHFSFSGRKIKWKTNTWLFGLWSSWSGTSHSAVIFNKTLYPRILLIHSGISLFDMRSRWAAVLQMLTDISFNLRSRCFPLWTALKKCNLFQFMEYEHVDIAASQLRLSPVGITASVSQAKDFCKIPSDYFWCRGPSRVFDLKHAFGLRLKCFPTHSQLARFRQRFITVSLGAGRQLCMQQLHLTAGQ